MNTNYYSLQSLESLNIEMIENLRKLAITNLGDLLAYQPFRYARLILAARDGRMCKDAILGYIDPSAHDKNLDEILKSPALIINGVGRQSNLILKNLGIDSVSDLAEYIPFSEAEEIITRTVSDDSDPSAPACVLPTCKKFTKNSKSYVSFFKQNEIRDLSVSSNGTTMISNLFRFTQNDTKVIYLGYSVSFLQEWIYCGIHLGEPQGSVNLFMGQDTQVSMLDWRRAIRAQRLEDTRASEFLTSTLFHQRAVDEVARATAEEHQHGGTTAFGANAATAGSFVAAGAVLGGLGGGISGGIAGLVLGNVANAAGGAPTIAGAIAGTAIGSMAGAAAGSLIFSGATTLGFVETDAEGDRGVFATSAQNIQQRTIQNSSSIRSFWSNIISQSVENEQQRLRTDRVTNHNRIHALNALYFEVLNEYRLNISANDFAPILFLPFKPIHFTKEVLSRYWWFIRTLLTDKKLVISLDEHFLTASTDPSAATQIAELPKIEEIETSEIEVEVNLDGSAMQDFFEDAIKATVVLAFLGPLHLVASVAALMVENLMNANKRKHVKVSIITSDGEIDLTRSDRSDSDPNFIGYYNTTTRVPVHTIEKVKITNDNPEFSVGTPEKIGSVSIPSVRFDLNELVFENISAKVSIRRRNSLRQTLDLGALENKRIIRERALTISANSSKNINWDISERLRAQFEGINSEKDELEDQLTAEQLTLSMIENLLNFLNANKYGFTRLILQNTEREQVINILEEVKIGNIDLSSIANTAPLGFCGNHVVLLLKKYLNGRHKVEAVTIDSNKLKLKLDEFDEVDHGNTEELLAYHASLAGFLDQFLQANTANDNNSYSDKVLLRRVKYLRNLLTADTLENDGDLRYRIKSLPMAITGAIRDILLLLKTPVEKINRDIVSICDYYGSVKKSLSGSMGKIIRSDEVSLPSPAIFMEPVLSNAKGAELYDMRRNSHYEILPSPGIATADPNVIRSQPVQLTPNVPVSNLTIQNAPEFPMPTSIGLALAEAGKLDLSTLLNTNAGTLNNTLANVSAIATELAKASAQLTGDAQKQALTSAGEVAKQVGDIIGKSLQGQSAALAAAAKPAPPVGQQSKAEVVRELDRINKRGGTEKEKKEMKESIGAPIVPDDSRDYQMSIIFLDEKGDPYPEGDFTLSMSFFERGSTFDINGGVSIPMSQGHFFFQDVYTLKKGRMATISINANIASVNIPGIREFTLPSNPDIVFKCRMKSEVIKISSTDVKSAVDQVIENSSFSAELNALFNLFLNSGIEFPFKIYKVIAGGGGKTDLNLRTLYNGSDSTTNTNTNSNTTLTEFEIILPKNGWDIEIVTM